MAQLVYIPLLILLLRARGETSLSSLTPGHRALFALAVTAGSAYRLASITNQVAIERDWVIAIADGDSAALTMLNAAVRRIDLLCALLAPLFVALLTSTAGYVFTAIFLPCFDAGGCLFELICALRPSDCADGSGISMVWRAAPVLARTDHQAPKATERIPVAQRIARYGRQQALDWSAFVRMRVFLTALSISALYLTVLSFDGTMLAFLKSHACVRRAKLPLTRQLERRFPGGHARRERCVCER